MKRSEINEAIKFSIGLLERHKFKLPSFAYWTETEWRDNRNKIETISEVMMGWDITDFGSGKFNEVGATLFTIRNGSVINRKAGTPYAEKIIILRHEKGQKIPMHRHLSKTEDIINRGGGVLCIQIYAVDNMGNPDTKADVIVFMDGIKHSYKAGEIVEITPGNSITLKPEHYHSFWAKKGAGDIIIGEVSSVNDDKTDNVFSEPATRFAEIEEDESIIHPLVNEYGRFQNPITE